VYIDRALKAVYNGNYGGPYEPHLWEITTGQLNKAVREEWAVRKPFVVDKAVTSQIKYQNAVFSAFKSTHQTRSLEQLKRAANAVSFGDFKKAAMPIVGKYQQTWLKSEYATAKRAMRSGQQYARALENTDLYPCLEYMPSRSQNPREAHTPYYHTVLPVTDSWWNTHLPPLDWRCDCWFQPVDKKPEARPANTEPPVPGLDNNPALTGATFSQTHPYFSNIDASVQQAIVQRTAAAIAGVDTKAFALFELDRATNGCTFALTRLAGAEKAKNLPTARAMAKRGNMVQLNGHADIDAMVNGTWNEFKHLGSTNPTAATFDRQLRDALTQYKSRNLKGDITVVLPTKAHKGALINGFNARETRSAASMHIENVHFVINGKYAGVKSLLDVVEGKLPF
jgi:hypothetical protein